MGLMSITRIVKETTKEGLNIYSECINYGVLRQSCFRIQTLLKIKKSIV